MVRVSPPESVEVLLVGESPDLLGGLGGDGPETGLVDLDLDLTFLASAFCTGGGDGDQLMETRFEGELLGYPGLLGPVQLECGPGGQGCALAPVWNSSLSSVMLSLKVLLLPGQKSVMKVCPSSRIGLCVSLAWSVS